MVEILLLTCQPYMTHSTLNIPQLKKIIIFDDNKDHDQKYGLPSINLFI